MGPAAGHVVLLGWQSVHEVEYGWRHRRRWVAAVRMRQGGHLAARTPGTAAAAAATMVLVPAWAATGLTAGDFVGYLGAASRDGL